MANDKDAHTINVDAKCNEFFDEVHDEIETHLARMKKNLEIVRNLRLSAAELEIETAILYHAELFKNVEELEAVNEKHEESLPCYK